MRIVVFYMNFEASAYSRSIQKVCFPIFLEVSAFYLN